MTVTAVRKDPHALSLTLDAEFDASPERVGSCGRTRASSSAGGARLPIPPPSRSTTSSPAAASNST